MVITGGGSGGGKGVEGGPSGDCGVESSDGG